MVFKKPYNDSDSDSETESVSVSETVSETEGESEVLEHDRDPDGDRADGADRTGEETAQAEQSGAEQAEQAEQTGGISAEKEGAEDVQSTDAASAESESGTPWSLMDTQVMNAYGIPAEYVAARGERARSYAARCGKTVTEYINEQKMLLARSIIESGEMSLLDISEYLGYNNYNYFCRVFKRVFGVPPTKMRKDD